MTYVIIKKSHTQNGLTVQSVRYVTYLWAFSPPSLSKTPTAQAALVDSESPEISVLDSECPVAEEFEVLFAPDQILASGSNLGLNPEACRSDLVKSSRSSKDWLAYKSSANATPQRGWRW